MLTIVSLLLATPVGMLLAIFSAEVLIGVASRKGCSAAIASPPPRRTVVLMPAHNEAGGIARTIAAFDRSQAELLVVADNCDDDTAAIARQAGARVVERHDPARRGKGYALAFGRDALAADPPECVVILDADCTVADGGVARLARIATASGRPVQSSYLFRPNPAAPPMVQVSNFAFFIKNRVRQRGMARIGRVAVLTGTGMAAPWTAFSAAPLATADRVEDLSLGIWFTRAGLTPRFAPDVETWSDPADQADLVTQRSRWEGGFIATARRCALPLIAEGVVRRSRSRFWLGLHLLVPPLALLFAIGVAVLLATATLALAGAAWTPPLALASLLGLAGIAVLLAWRAEGREQVGVRALLRVPHYVAGKLPLYRGLLGGADSGWVRTRRPDESESAERR